MITDPFDTGPTGTFRTLCRNYPDDTVFKGADGFRSLWGPIFYRGRANATARLLVIGQDPAQTEAVTRRCLSGQAGRRVQGFVEKLGYSKSYLMINAFLYGIYNQSMALPHLNDPEIQAYRHQWLEAALAAGQDRSRRHVRHPRLQRVDGVHGDACRSQCDRHAPFPQGTAPHVRQARRADHAEGSARQLECRSADSCIQRSSTLTWPSRLVPYGGDFTAAELPEIPSRDFPMGLPSWMRDTDFWASLPPTTPGTPGTERANISITVP